jgi:galactose mutarotase-like enzyme
VHRVEPRSIAGYEAVALCSDALGGIDATFVTGAGMVGCSLTHRGDELLGQRGGLEHYVNARSTMGIPFLHPYANRLSEDHFRVGDDDVDLAKAPDRVARDPNGLAIHGLLAGISGWELTASEADGDGARLAGRFDFGARDELIAAFPFPHLVTLEFRLAGAELSIATEVEATGDVAVPISFGFHPYLHLPGAPRSAWQIDAPVSEHLALDDRSLPTGERVREGIEAGPLGERTFDDVYAGVADGTVFSVAGGGRRLEVEFAEGFPIAVVYAPDDDDVICFEPMTAPTNALVDGAPELRFVDPGERFAATWRLRLVA